MDTSPATAPVSLRSLHEPVLRLIDEQQFEQALKLLEAMFRLGESSPIMMLTCALALIETGRGQSALPLLGVLENGPSGPKLKTAVRAIRTRVTSTPWDPQRAPYAEVG